MAYEVNLLVGGKDVSASSGATFERRNPLSGTAVSLAAAATASDAHAAVDAAAAAFPAWSALGPGERRARLNAAADALEARARQLAEAMCAETGATAAWAEELGGKAPLVVLDAITRSKPFNPTRNIRS